MGEPIEGKLLPVKRGPKNKYTPEMCDAIVAAASSGGHIPEMMLSIGIKSKDTWYRWQKENPEFKEAVEYSKIVNQAFYEKIGLKGIMGEIPNFNATTFALMMNNKFGDEYKRSHSGNGPTEITVNTVNYNEEQTTEKIAQKLEKLKALGVDLGSK